jgi:hypothetical protein
MVGHNLMSLKGDRDDSTVATYQPTVYTEKALKKVRDSDNPPTMEELEEASLGECSDSSSSMPSLSPPPSPGVAATTSRKATKKQDNSTKKPSWTSRSIANSDRSDDDAAITTPMFSTPVSVAESQSEAPPLEPITYDFADATPRGRISRKKKYTKASARIARGERPDSHELKSNQRSVVTNSIRAANEPSLSIPDLKMTDLMMETNFIDNPQASFLSLRRVASDDDDDDASVDVIVSDECMEPSSVVAPRAPSAPPTARALAMTDNADEQVGKNGLAGHEGPTAEHLRQLVEKKVTTEPDEGKSAAANAKEDEPDVGEMTAPTDHVAPGGTNTPKAENKKKLSAAVVDKTSLTKAPTEPAATPVPPSGFPNSPYIVADKDLPEWMRKFKQMGLDTVAEPHGRP